MASLSSNERRRARLYRIAGDIERERLDNDSNALDFYLKTLRITPLDSRAQGSAERILSRNRDWHRLSTLYEELLQRIPPPIAGQEDGRVPILSELMELYRYQLDNRAMAITACEQLLSIASGDLKVREDLARLYEADGRLDDAVALHQSLISDSPFSVDSYHALRRIHELRGQRDRMLCLSATLAFLDEANQDEMKLLRNHRSALPVPTEQALPEHLYGRLLLHPRASGLLGELFTFAADYCRPALVREQKEYKLKSRHRLRLADPGSELAGYFREALSFMGLVAPEVYSKGAGVKGVMALNTSPIAVLYSEEAVQKASGDELRFMVGRAVAFARTENLLAASMSPKRLHQLIEALEEVAFPDTRIHPVSDEVFNLARKLHKVVPQQRLGRLQQLITRFREQSDELVIRDWVEGVEHTCNRAGFVLCGNLEAAVEVLKAARVHSPSGTHRSLIRELIFYSISDDYFELREAAGAAIS
jgi:tetratricopeptide (TPR) repeat protein